jgi:hypothetical protein
MFEERFDACRMAEEYVAVYQRLKLDSDGWAGHGLSFMERSRTRHSRSTLLGVV